MKDLTGRASIQTPVNPAAAWALLRDVQTYPEWIGRIVREAQVLARSPDGLAERVHTKLRAHLGPFDREFELMLAVSGKQDDFVLLERLPHEPNDEESVRMHWTVTPGPVSGGGTTVSIELKARLDVPRFLPLPSNAGDEIAKRFVQGAAERLNG